MSKIASLNRVEVEFFRRMDEIATDVVALRRPAAGPWSSQTLVDGDTVLLESIGFTAPLAAFYRTVGSA
jgi:hypothetical protein